MNLLECRATFLFASGAQFGRYHYEAIAIYQTKEGFVSRKLFLKFQPFNSAYFIQNFELNTEGAWKHKNSINTVHNPLPQPLQNAQWSAIRSVFDNYDKLNVCKTQKTGEDKNMKHFSVGDGQFFITEVPYIRKIDFDNFIKHYENKIVVIAENGEMKY